MKYIFVTGGVVSSLGKGLVSASLGTLLEKRGLKIVIQKFDPYLNIDPGTMSPFQHGEVYVLDDGSETDLDLGHYERFTWSKLSKLNNLTSGQLYDKVIKKEREGKYLGATVQVIPHITNEIIRRIYKVSKNSNVDVVITEIGGTIGDIEGLPFLEALRQFQDKIVHDNVCFVHVTLVPFIKAAEELKTKPTQQSVAKLREIGIKPDIIICRSEFELDEDIKNKIAMFCNVKKESVIPFLDIEGSIYESPIKLHENKLDEIICDKLNIENKNPDLTEWKEMLKKMINPSLHVKIAIIGKYIELKDAYKSIYESLKHAGAFNDTCVELIRIDSTDINEHSVNEILSKVSGILIPGGFGDRGTKGKIIATKYARENKIPYLGICLGMQIATIEFAINVCYLKEANSLEFDKKTKHPVICLLDSQKKINKKGGTMRKGAYATKLKEGSLSKKLYGKDIISERHRHRYEFNFDYKDEFEKKGLYLTGTSDNETLGEIIEIYDHPFFIGVQFHPEFQSKPTHSHPLFKGFIKASLQNKLK